MGFLRGTCARRMLKEGPLEGGEEARESEVELGCLLQGAL